MRYRFYSIVSVLVLTSTGCMYNGGSPYGNYGPGPTVMPSQPSYGYPMGSYPTYNPSPNPIGQPYIQPNQPPQSQPLSQPTLTDPNSPPETYKGGDNNPPPYNPRSPAGGVPDPTEPLDDNNSSGSNSPQLSPTTTTSRRSPANEDLSTPFGQESSTRMPRTFAQDYGVDTEPVFHAPVQQASHEAGVQVPYGQGEQFDWLQGYVEYDEPTKTWVIIYNDNPPPTDKLGGEATLGDHAALKSLQDGQVVRVEGTFDKRYKDSRNCPVFRITKLNKVQNR